MREPILRNVRAEVKFSLPAAYTFGEEGLQ